MKNSGKDYDEDNEDSDVPDGVKITRLKAK